MITELQTQSILGLFADGMSVSKISRVTGISRWDVSCIVDPGFRAMRNLQKRKSRETETRKSDPTSLSPNFEKLRFEQQVKACVQHLEDLRLAYRRPIPSIASERPHAVRLIPPAYSYCGSPSAICAEIGE